MKLWKDLDVAIYDENFHKKIPFFLMDLRPCPFQVPLHYMNLKTIKTLQIKLQ